MPTYEYRCTKCGVFETQQRITAPPLEKCPTCGGPVQRLISRNVSVLYLAPGFHTTDYRSESYKEKAKAESKEADGAKAAS
ncbi:MAG: hypothetical protein PWP65_1637 [Clostridia bacterium]|nr:hypothetical protein [Clostridia bacterium]